MLPGTFALIVVLRPIRPLSFRSFYCREEMYQALPALSYWLGRKAGRGTGNEATPNQHRFESSLENTLSCSFDFGDGHDLAYFQSKSQVLGHMTTQHVMLIQTSA